MATFDHEKVTATGSGLGMIGVVTVNKWAEFSVDASDSCANKAPLHITCIDEDHHVTRVCITETGDRTYKCRYLPKKDIEHTIMISYDGAPIPNSPYRVQVQGASDPSKIKVGGPGKVEVSGPAIEGLVQTFQPTNFTVNCHYAGPGDLYIALTNECGLDMPVQITKCKNDIFQVDFKPKSAGTYSACVFFADQEIPTSPHKFQVEPSMDVRVLELDDKLRRRTLGLVQVTIIKRTGPFLWSVTNFTIDASSVVTNGKGKVNVFVKSPSGTCKEGDIINNNDGTYKCMYTPFEQGKNKIEVLYEGLPIPCCPIPVNVVPGCDPTRVKAHGPGLEGGYTLSPKVFYVETQGAGMADVDVHPVGPSEMEVTCLAQECGKHVFQTSTTKAGEYLIHIKYGGQNIPDSPFKVQVSVNITCDGAGLDPSGVQQGVLTHFVVNAPAAKVALLKATFVTKSGQSPIQLTPNGDSRFLGGYTPPNTEGPARVEVEYADEPVPGSPFLTKVVPTFDASKVKVHGEGVRGEGNLASVRVSFVIDTKEAGAADIDVNITDPKDQPVSSNIQNCGDGTYCIKYLPEEFGKYIIDVKYGGKTVPEAPYYVNTEKTGNASNVKIIEDTVDATVIVGEESVIKVNVSEAGKGNLTCHIHSNQTPDIDVLIMDNCDGTVSLIYTPHIPGAYTLNINFGGQPVPNGQIKQQAKLVHKAMNTHCIKLEPSKCDAEEQGDIYEALDPSKVTVEGLIESEIYEQKKFTLCVQGKGRLDVDFKDPEKSLTFRVVQDVLGKVDVCYMASQPGTYPILVQGISRSDLALVIRGEASLFREKVVQKVASVPEHDVNKPKEVLVTIPDSMKYRDVSVVITSPSGNNEQCKLRTTDMKDVYSAEFVPKDVGIYIVTIETKYNHIEQVQVTVGTGSGSGAHRVVATGRGLRSGEINKPCKFFLDTTAAGGGGGKISVTMKGPSKAHISFGNQKLQTGIVPVCYTCSAPGEYHVSVKYNEEHISASPFKIHMSPGDEDLELVHIRDKKEDQEQQAMASQEVEDSEEPKEEEDVAMEQDEKEEKNEEEGVGALDSQMQQNGHQGDSSQTVITSYRADDSRSRPHAKRKSGHTSDGRTLGDLKQKTEKRLKTVDNSSLDQPEEEDGAKTEDDQAADLYEHIKEGQKHVRQTMDAASKDQEQQAMASQEEDVAMEQDEKEEKIKELCFKARGLDLRSMDIYSARPLGPLEDLTIMDLGKLDEEDKNMYLVEYGTPECGLHKFVARYNGHVFVSAPYFVTFGERTELMLHAHGPGLHKGVTGEPQDFTVEIANAHAWEGTICVLLTGPSEALVKKRVNSSGNFTYHYWVSAPGDYQIHIKSGGQHIRGSPYQAHIVDAGMKQSQAGVPQQSASAQDSSVDASQAGGENNQQNIRVKEGLATLDLKIAAAACVLDDSSFYLPIPDIGSSDSSAQITSPSGVKEVCPIRSQEEDLEQIFFTPNETGIHSVSITHENVDIPGSPFVFTVGHVTDVGGHKIRAIGKDLRTGQLNAKCGFCIFTREAGAGLLSVSIDGPSTAEINFNDKDGAVGFQYCCKVAGIYKVSIQFNDVHIPDSPFEIRV